MGKELHSIGTSEKNSYDNKHMGITECKLKPQKMPYTSTRITKI